jgi:hypothetical protein
MRLFFLFLTLFFYCQTSFSQTGLSTGKQHAPEFLFIENKGQIKDVANNSAGNVKFMTFTQNFKLFLTNTGVSYQWENNNNKNGGSESYRINLTLKGAKPNPVITSYQPKKDIINYYNLGKEAELLSVQHFAKVVYANIYEGIDWVWYYKNGNIKYEFIVHPNADYKQIKLVVTGASTTSIDNNGSLIITTPFGEIKENSPITFIQDKTPVESAFNIDNNVLSFNVAEYNKSQKLIIDPTIIWGTYYGGTDNDEAMAVETDTLGNSYLSGLTLSTTNIANNGYSNSANGGYDAFLVKFDKLGNRVWSTYYGGESHEELWDITVDEDNNIYLVGSTLSSTLPTKNAHQSSIGGGFVKKDGFIAKFSPSGNLLWATYYGGDESDYCHAIGTDSQGNVFVGGRTRSKTNIAKNGFENTKATFPEDEIYLAKFDSAGVLQWGTYIRQTFFEGIGIDNSDNIYVIGSHSGQGGGDLPIKGVGFQTTRNGLSEGFILKFNQSGTPLWNTYYGGSDFDNFYDVAIDSDNNVYAVGRTRSGSSISSNGHQNNLNGNFDGVIVKFDSLGNRVWGTYFGGLELDYIRSCSFDVFGNLLVAGITQSNSLGINGIKNTYKGGTFDGFYAKFKPDGTFLWSSYHGGTKIDDIKAIRTDVYGNFFFCGFTESVTEIAQNGFKNTKSSGASTRDAFMVKITDLPAPDITKDTLIRCGAGKLSFTGILPSHRFSLRWYDDSASTAKELETNDTFSLTVSKSGTYWVALYNGTAIGEKLPVYAIINPLPKANFQVNDSSQCFENHNFIFTNTSTIDSGNLSYSWNFGDGSASVMENPTKAFASDTSTFAIQLIATSDSSCTDTITKPVTINPHPEAKFSLAVSKQCANLPFDFTNESDIKKGTITYKWKFGDGDSSNSKSPNHFYNSGQYVPKLVATSDKNCKDSTALPITSYAIPQTTTITGDNTTNKGSTKNYSVPYTTGSTYSWNITGGTQTAGADSNVIEITWGNGTIGTINVTETTANNCSNLIATLNVSLQNLSVNSHTLENSIKVFPNPCDYVLNIRSKNKVSFTLVDVVGKVVIAGEIDSHTENTFNTNHLKNGLYFLHFTDEFNRNYTNKLIIAH